MMSLMCTLYFNLDNKNYSDNQVLKNIYPKMIRYCLMLKGDKSIFLDAGERSF